MKVSHTYFILGFVSAIACLGIPWLLYQMDIFHSKEIVSLHHRPRIVVFGDSLTQRGYFAQDTPNGQESFFSFCCLISYHNFFIGEYYAGWVALLSSWYSRKADILNRGFSGYNSQWGVNIMDDVVLSINPDLCFIFFGANDAVDSQVLQHVDLESYRKNIELMIKKLQQVIENQTKVTLV